MTQKVLEKAVTHEVKTCVKCEQTKPKTEFPKNAVSPDGLLSWCRTCKQARDRQRRIDREEAHRDSRVLPFRKRLPRDELKAMRERMAEKLADPVYRARHNEQQRRSKAERRTMDAMYVEHEHAARQKRAARMTHVYEELVALRRDIADLKAVLTQRRSWWQRSPKSQS